MHTVSSNVRAVGISGGHMGRKKFVKGDATLQVHGQFQRGASRNRPHVVALPTRPPGLERHIAVVLARARERGASGDDRLIDVGHSIQTIPSRWTCDIRRIQSLTYHRGA